MKIKEAFTHISARAYLHRCRYTYEGLCTFEDTPFEDLPYSMQLGIIEMIWALYRVQKMVFVYDLEYVSRCLMGCGVKLRPFYDACGINKTFYLTRSLAVNREERLMLIRMHIILMINRLMAYVLTDSYFPENHQT